MKKLITFSFFWIFSCVWGPLLLFAQPPNDNVCNARAITLDAPAVIVNNLGATAEPGESSITPPFPTTPGPAGLPLCGPGGWCDGLIGHSVWFKFTASATTAVSIDICGSDFDSQLALYEVGDCADFSTFNLILSMDDQAGCGPAEGFSSFIRMECLNPGQEYYVLVDDWQASDTTPIDTGDIVIVISEEEKIDPGITLTGGPVIINPVCPGGNEGSIDIDVISGVEPITYLWSNGERTQDISNLTAGTYTVTVTDFCQTSVVASFDLDDPDEPQAITLGNFPNQVVHPTHCGDGQLGGQITLPIPTGVPPFTYEWSNGDSLAILSNLPDGEYTVTITDACLVVKDTLVHTFYLGASAGPDIELGATCGEVPIGLDHSETGGEARMFTYNTDQAPGGNVHCRFLADNSISESTHWRSFNLADFSIPSGARLTGVEVFVRNRINVGVSSADAEPGLSMEFELFITNTMELDDPGLTLISVDQVATPIPSTSPDGTYSSYFIPFDGAGIGPGDIIAVAVTTKGDFGQGHFFNLGANETATPGSTTYFSGCGLGITELSDLTDANGNPFLDETIMNLYFSTESGLTYNWSGPVDDPNSPTPIAMGIGSATYHVTITDEACNTSFTDSVEVVCWTVGTEEPGPETFSIHPNPGNGFFQLVNEGADRQMRLQVFDLQGRLVHTEQTRIGYGATHNLDLRALAKGIYLAKLSHENSVETYKLVIQ